jgi:hypothetical protein
VAKEVRGARFICSDGDKHSEHGFGTGFFYFDACNKDLREFVHEHAIQQLLGCDFVFAYLETPDSFGAIAEIAFASALKKHIILVILVPPTAADDPEGHDEYGALFDAYWFVSCFPSVRVFPVHLQSEAVQILQAARWRCVPVARWNSMPVWRSGKDKELPDESKAAQ